MRKLACLWWKQALAEHATDDRIIPENSHLAKHLERCPACVRDLAWYRATHRNLQGSLSAERATSDFADAAWARFTAIPSPHPASGIVRALPVAVCAAGLALLLVVRHPWSSAPTNSPDRTAFAVTQPMEKGTTQPTVRMAESGRSLHGTALTTAGTREKVIDRPHTARRHEIRRTRSHRSWARRKPNRTDKQFASNSRLPNFSWERLASWYEVQGDYRSAAAAYDQAVRESPTEAREFNAGRTAECAGDIAQAITYYAHILTNERAQESPTQQNTPSEKGPSQWNEDRYFL